MVISVGGCCNLKINVLHSQLISYCVLWAVNEQQSLEFNCPHQVSGLDNILRKYLHLTFGHVFVTL